MHARTNLLVYFAHYLPVIIMTTPGNNERKKRDIIYAAFAESFFENAFFGMIRRVDSSLMQLLGFCLAFVTAEAVITALVNVSGGLTTWAIILFLISCCAFLVSSLVLLWAIAQRATLDIDWDQDISVLVERCKEDLERLYNSKHRKQTISVAILFAGVGLLLASIIYAFSSVSF